MNKIINKNLTAFDILRNFYATNQLLSEAYAKFRRNEIEITHQKLKPTLKKIKKKAQKVKKWDLVTQDMEKYHLRYDNYMNSDWDLKKISLENCGVWPKMGGLPHKATKGNVIDTAKYIRPLLKDKKQLTFKTSDALYIEEMMKYAQVINKFFPIIVLRDGVIRQLKLRKEKFQKKYKKCKYDIDDGCHRAVALALQGKKEIIAYVGKRKCKSDLLYPK